MLCRMSSVSLKKLVKRFGPVCAVDRVSLEIAEGEFFSILGPSGCGKSTTLRLIAGFEEITEGAIELDGEDVSGLPPERRDIGFVFQNYAIFVHMSVFENIAFGLRLRKVPEPEIRKKVAAALDQVGMPGLESRMQGELSGGQQQRVALARVLVTEPRILLLDEPLSALDKNLREEMKFWIKDLQFSLGITTIYVTHDQGEALTMSDRIAVMDCGRVAQVGRPRDIYETPENLFVAEFIGESNSLTGTICTSSGMNGTIKVADYILTARLHSDLTDGQDASLVLRPEQVMVGSAPSPNGWNEVTATATSVSYQGANLRYTFDLLEQKIISETPNRPDAPKLKTGQTVKLHWRGDAGCALPEVRQ